MKKRYAVMDKGMFSGVALSLLIHIAAFLLAGMLVVFTVTRKPDQSFDPPLSTERPKMKLKKPKVRIKKSRPRSTVRIVSESRRTSMPNIQLPDISGMGEGLGEGMGIGDGFDMLDAFEGVSVFGSGQTIGNDLEGTFYDLKRDRLARPIPYSREDFAEAVRKFTQRGFDVSVFSRYYKSPQKLYTSTIMVPPILSLLGPMAYNEPDIPGTLFLIHYQGDIVYPEDITFRFWGGSGDVLIVGIDRKIVLNACWSSVETKYCPTFQSSSADHRKHMLGFQRSAVGDWITLKAGEPRRMDVLMGEEPGGGFSAELLVEVKGVEYERNTYGAPILPVFKTSELTPDQMDAIYNNLVEGEACLTNGPIFRDYDYKKSTSQIPTAKEIPEPEKPDPSPLRLWTLSTGEQFEGKFQAVVGGHAVISDISDRQRKIILETFSDEDRKYISLVSPPDFSFDFSKKTFPRPPIDPGPYISMTLPSLIDYQFTAKIKQVSPGNYENELKAEFFAIGEEIDGDNYILLDRQTSVFTLSSETDRTHEFTGKKVLLNDYYNYWRDRRGEKYGGYMIVLTDERGIIIGHQASSKWLFGILDELRALPVGRHFDKSGQRVIPPRPKRNY